MDKRIVPTAGRTTSSPGRATRRPTLPSANRVWVWMLLGTALGMLLIAGAGLALLLCGPLLLAWLVLRPERPQLPDQPNAAERARRLENERVKRIDR